MKYRLLARHVLADQRLVEAGTEVGDDTPYPWKSADGTDLPPTTQMEGVDDAGREMVRKVHQRLYGSDPSWERAGPNAERDAQDRQGEEQRKLDEKSKPVSDQQKAERDGAPGNATLPGPGRQVSSTATVAPTTGGVTAPSPGPATPKPPEPEDARPTNPNKDQYPKDA